MNRETVIFIAGPTASGKSRLALKLAQKQAGEIVNADAMQVYADLRVLTARPSTEDEACIPHHIYGVIDGAERCSAGRWARMAAPTIEDIVKRGKIAIVVGGTGLYFKALEEGLSPVPEVPEEIRALAKARRNEIGAAAFRKEVISADPAMTRLPEGDTQRLVRAWEVFKATGKPLSYFQARPREPLMTVSPQKFVLTPERENLYRRCDARASAMFDEGGIDEAAQLLQRRLDPSLPVMKALGVGEIAGFLAGRQSRDGALADLQQETRRFAKRQLTWFRNQTRNWHSVSDVAQFEASF
ncbi:MAG: tRNA (adenosine(37)-N6)-dimethylallyltransferase MiaA [Pseudomonadota bacterium]